MRSMRGWPSQNIIPDINLLLEFIIYNILQDLLSMEPWTAAIKA